MIIIAHRANIDGLNPATENSPAAVIKCLKLGFDVEVDVWYQNGQYFLGHDQPQYAINKRLLELSGVWCHAKNLETMACLLQNPNIHCFWHESDKMTLTSKGIPWCFPGYSIVGGISVMREAGPVPSERILGICTNWPNTYV